MRKILVLLLILMISLPAGLFGAESKSSSSKDNNELDNVYPDLLPEPYDPDEYPAWTKKLRHPSEMYKVGDVVQAKVLTVDQENEKFTLEI